MNLIDQRTNGEVKIERSITWKMFEQNSWSTKVSRTNYMLVYITPFENGKYEVKYVDADIEAYNNQERAYVRNLYDIAPSSMRELAVKLTEHYGHYEWKEVAKDKQELMEVLMDQTSFRISLLAELEEFKDL